MTTPLPARFNLYDLFDEPLPSSRDPDPLQSPFRRITCGIFSGTFKALKIIALPLIATVAFIILFPPFFPALLGYTVTAFIVRSVIHLTDTFSPHKLDWFKRHGYKIRNIFPHSAIVALIVATILGALVPIAGGIAGATIGIIVGFTPPHLKA